MSKKSTSTNYLNKFGHACQLPVDCYQDWQDVVIVPICGEGADCIQRMTQIVDNIRYLIIACVNRPEDHRNSNQWRHQNSQLITHLKLQSSSVISLDNGYLLSYDCFDIWLLDFNNKPFDKNQGVGYARKIAADSALQLISEGAVKNPWIYSADADVQLPTNYFSVTDNYVDCVAYSLAFQHVADSDELSYWQALYDFKLYYYQRAMRFIGTVYDYIPLGSCLIIAANSYAKVRGFPIRSGGEDFYLLNKLAKIGPIGQPEKPLLKIEARLSQRVPFGTGPGLIKIRDNPESVRFYHPQIFAEIKLWNEQLSVYFETRILPDNLCINGIWHIEHVITKAMKQTKTTERWHQFVLEWFDAFRILKTVHTLEMGFPRLQLSELREIDLFNDLTEGLVVPE